MRFFNKAFKQHGFPKTVVMDKSGSNKAAIGKIIEDKHLDINVRQIKYLNNIVEQDHRAIKRMVRPMLGLLVVNQRGFITE
ncbi:DDE superfamily endonuclease [Hydromonas duriensis]|uniref:DDE superfamily endonuclease n=1 Tax=Hydromonas duriensis TaxID=1527608 RepID=A0A4R6Y1H7_9BURK|nr:DDE superfamily endonuclease [Hydromonas duriensis]